MKHEIKNRFSSKVQFTAEIDCAEDASINFKIGLAVKWALKNKADLGGAYLGGADLGGAYLGGAYLGGAYLGGAYLGGAYLGGAYLGGADLGGAYLGGADLGGADLGGAYLGGYKINSIIARVARNDGYEFIGFDTDKGLIVQAGCRLMSVADYRAHIIREYPHTDKARETTDILDFIEQRAAP